MILCPACQAENPDGTRLCVKCAAQLPESSGEKTSTGKKFSLKEWSRDTLDVIWVVLIILLMLVFFLKEMNWSGFEKNTFRIGELKWPMAEPTPEAKPLQARPKAKPRVMGETPAARPVDPQALYAQSKRKFDQWKYRESWNLLKQALEIDPRFAKAYYGLGAIYTQADMEDAAVRMLEMAVRLDPRHWEAWNNLAMRYYQAGNFVQAARIWDWLVRQQPEEPLYAYHLGLAAMETGETEKAVGALEKATRLSPDDPTVWNALALAYEKSGDAEKAKPTWEKVRGMAQDEQLQAQADRHLAFLQSVQSSAP